MGRDLHVLVEDKLKPALSNKPHFGNGFLRTNLNMLLMSIARRLPFQLNNRLIEFIGVNLGEDVYMCYGVWFDGLNPGMISIGDRTTIGGGVKILAHEATQDEYRVGRVDIGDDVLVGAESMILPGVEIGDGATIAARSLVHRDVEEGEFVGGNPIETIEEGDAA